MTRLSEDRIKQGILHSDPNVRFACLCYFADCFSPSQTIMPVAIEALERFGRIQGFRYLHPIADLAQTEETIRWIVGELTNQPRRTEEERSYLDHLSRLLCRADPRLVLPRESEILASGGFDQDYHNQLTHRLKLLSWDGDALWRELEAICEEGKDKVYIGDIRYGEGEQMVEALAREGDRHADRMMSLLGVTIENFESNPMKWIEPFMVRLAGELHYQPAIPHIVSKLHQDAEVLSEECLRALVKIGTDEVVRTIQLDFPTAEWHFRLYASGVLGRIHTELAVEASIKLLENEEDGDIENFLAQSLVEHFSYPGNEAARRVLLSDPGLFDLQRALVPACTLMEQHFPELETWRKEIEEKTRRFQRNPVGVGGVPKTPTKPPAQLAARASPTPRSVGPRPVPVEVERKVGRNDPCPCGSGKKYKKCCIEK